MYVNPELVLPSQSFLKPDTVRFILECYVRKELNRLPPLPIVRQDEEGDLVAIDGHNLIAVKAFRDEIIEVHLAYGPENGLPTTSDANIKRNQDLREKYTSVLSDRKKVESEGVFTFRDLIAKYPELFND